MQLSNGLVAGCNFPRIIKRGLTQTGPERFTAPIRLHSLPSFRNGACSLVRKMQWLSLACERRHRRNLVHHLAVRHQNFGVLASLSCLCLAGRLLCLRSDSSGALPYAALVQRLLSGYRFLYLPDVDNIKVNRKSPPGTGSL
jgi:hypothetical protein